MGIAGTQVSRDDGSHTDLVAQPLKRVTANTARTQYIVHITQYTLHVTHYTVQLKVEIALHHITHHITSHYNNYYITVQRKL